MADSEQDLLTLYAGRSTRNDRLRNRLKRLCCRKADDPGPEFEPAGKVRIPPREETELSFKRGLSFLTQGAIEKWTTLLYRSSYGKTFLWFIVVYFTWNVLNSFILLAVVIAYDNHEKECLNGWNYELEGSDRFRENFEIAFSLSWTTFSTVGYGTISPPDEHGCMGLRFLLSYIAFTGILFSGFCGAILYSKVSRQTSEAKITFSSAACLQFGKGITTLPLLVTNGVDDDDVLESDLDETEDEYIPDLDAMPEVETTKGENKTKSKTSPCPVIDFRFVNDKYKLAGHDLLKASLSCVAVSMKASPSLRKAIRRGSTPNGDPIADVGWSEPARKVYTKLKVIPNDIPIVDSVLYFRHVLDETSPLLESSVKKKIVELGGWPSTMNDYISIRNSISKSLLEIGISFEATSDLTADGVFKIHRYAIEDIYIGWRFVGLCRTDWLVETDFFKKRQNPTAEQVRDLIDMDRIHDIMPQYGGGSEPLKRTAGERERSIYDVNQED